MKTAVTELLGIEHPILLPGMSWISKPALVAAVSEAGGLGILATGPLTTEETRKSIREVRNATNKPFGIGVTLMMPGASENAAVALDEQVPVLNFQLGKGKWLIDGVHRYGGKAIPTVTSVRHAISAERAGADAVLVTGHEAAAHGEEVTSMVLLPAVANVLGIPIIGAGGFADGRGLAAALALGAGAIAMGTRFAATQESALHDDMKKVIVEKQAEETLYTENFDGMWARIMRTPTSVRVTHKPMSFVRSAIHAMRAGRDMGMPMKPILQRLFQNPEQIRLLSHFGAAMPMVEAATINGDIETGVQFIGQSQGLVDDIPSACELVRQVVDEAESVLTALQPPSTAS
jgi:enoyl-[acyl-carrier protein] reductase II